MKKIFFILMLLIYSLSFSKIEVNIDNKNLNEFDQTQLHIIFLNENPVGYSFENLEENFRILAKRRNQEFRNINGQKTSLIEDTYLIEPQKIGKSDIVVNFSNGEKRKLSVETKKDGDLSNKIDNSRKNEKKYIKIETSPLKNRYYLGEKIIYSENLIYSPNDVEIESIINLETNAFNVEVLPNKANSNSAAGVKVNLLNAILTPISLGERSFSGSGIKYLDFNSGEIELLLPKPKKIEILELPKNAPKGFKNTVGKIEVKTSLDKTKSKIGSPIILTVTLSGEGNVKEINNIYPDEIDGATIYQTEKKYNEAIVDDKYISKKTIEVAILPKKSGVLELPEVKIPYFNTEKEKYDYLTINSMKIDIEGENNSTKIDNNKSPINKNIDKNIIENKLEKNNINNEVTKKVKIDELISGETENTSIYKKIAIMLGILSIFEFIIIIYLYRVNINKDRTNERKR